MARWFVFDFKCDECGHLEENMLVDANDENPPVCPKCGKPMSKKVGTAWEKHVSWSKWSV
jgi:putative FmdB family regulatory protein